MEKAGSMEVDLEGKIFHDIFFLSFFFSLFSFSGGNVAFPFNGLGLSQGLRRAQTNFLYC